MNRYKKNILISPQPTETLYVMKLTVNGVKIFDGKITVLPNQTSLEVDLTQLLAGCQYKGYNAIQPVYDYTTQEYTQPTSRLEVLEEEFATAREAIKADWIITFSKPDTGGVVAQESGQCLLINGGDAARLQSTFPTFRAFDTEKPVCHYPPTTSNKLRLIINEWVKSGTQTDDSIYADGAERLEAIISYNVRGGNNIVNVPMSDLFNHAGKHLWLNDDGGISELGVVDACAAPYYLMWMDFDGHITCQRFTPASVYGEEYTTNYRVGSDDTKYIANSFTEGTWRLKSYILKDNDFKYYMTMMSSPYVILWDSAKERLVYVLPDVRSMEAKTFATNNRKPVYFEVELNEISPKNYFL